MKKYLLTTFIVLSLSWGIYAQDVVTKAYDEATHIVLYAPEKTSRLKHCMEQLRADTSLDGAIYQLEILCQLEYNRIVNDETQSDYISLLVDAFIDICRYDSILQNLFVFHNRAINYNSVYNLAISKLSFVELVNLCRLVYNVMTYRLNLNHSDFTLDQRAELLAFKVGNYYHIERKLFDDHAYMDNRFHQRLPDSLANHLSKFVHIEDVHQYITLTYHQIEKRLQQDEFSIIEPYTVDILVFTMLYGSEQDAKNISGQINNMYLQHYGSKGYALYQEQVVKALQSVYHNSPFVSYYVSLAANQSTYSDTALSQIKHFMHYEDSLRMCGYDFVDQPLIFYDGSYLDTEVYKSYRQQKTLSEYFFLRDILLYTTKESWRNLLNENNKDLYIFYTKYMDGTEDPTIDVLNFFAFSMCQDVIDTYNETPLAWLVDAMDMLVTMYSYIPAAVYHPFQYYYLYQLTLTVPYKDIKMRISKDIIAPALMGQTFNQKRDSWRDVLEAYAYALQVICVDHKDSIYLEETERIYQLSKHLPLFDGMWVRYHSASVFKEFGDRNRAKQIIEHEVKQTAKLSKDVRQYIHDALLIDLLILNVEEGNYEQMIPYYEQIYDKTLLDNNPLLMAFVYAYQGNYSQLHREIDKHMQDVQHDVQVDLFNCSGDKSKFMEDLLFYSENLYMIYNVATNDSCRQLLAEACYDLSLMTKSILLSVNYQIEQKLQNHPSEVVRRQYAHLKHLQTQIVDPKDLQLQWTHQIDISITEQTLMSEIRNWNDSHESSFTIYNWNHVQQSLGEDTVAIEFTKYEGFDKSIHYGLLALRKQMLSPTFIYLGSDSLLTAAMGGKRISRIFEMNQLSSFIWSKVIDSLHIQPNEHLFFAAEGALYQIPIEYLPYDSIHTMADVFDIHRVSSTRELCRTSYSHSCTDAVLFGGIQYDLSHEKMKEQSEHVPYKRGLIDEQVSSLMRDSTRGRIIPLPGTLNEVRMIAPLFAHSRSYVGEMASEEAFKALDGECGEVLHIGTHGFFLSISDAERRAEGNADFLRSSSQSPIDYSMSRTGLLLAGAKLAWEGKASPVHCEDGILTAKEIATLDLHQAQLVVLSACETGLGEITSDGVAGLQRGFKKAGVQSILMSLWPVDDNATQLLMTEFYRQWMSGKSKHEALRQAQRAVRFAVDQYGDHMYENPEYWAGFIMLD